MGKRKNHEFWESAYLNDANYIQYYRRLVELATSMFEWVNVPETIDIRYLELTLFARGSAVFFKDDVLGYLALPNTVASNYNVYRIPTIRRAIADNGYNKELDINNSVLIYNNYLHTNSKLDVQMFAKRLYELDRAIDVNTKAQKTPILIKCAENQRLSLENLYKEYDGNAPVIWGEQELNNNCFDVLTTGAPYVADRLYELKTQLWNEALTYLGISNINIQKKERLITDEVSRNMGSVIASRYSRLQARKDACEQINRMFPELNIDCRYREDYVIYDDNIDESEAVDNG